MINIVLKAFRSQKVAQVFLEGWRKHCNTTRLYSYVSAVADTEDHRPDGPTLGHALTIKPGRSDQATQPLANVSPTDLLCRKEGSMKIQSPKKLFDQWRWICLEIVVVGSVLAQVAGAESTQIITDEKAKIEELLSSTERVGLQLQGTKVVTAELALCELTLETQFEFPDPNPAGVKYQIVAIDLHLVEEIEQREHSGRYFLRFRPHGFGSPFRRMIELGATERFSRWDGKEFENTENFNLVHTIPLEGRAEVGSLLQEYTERNCKEGSI